jgi:hypothetical protein
MGLHPPTGGYGRFDRWNSLPVWLQHAGYTTAHIGKYLNGYGSQVIDQIALRHRDRQESLVGVDEAVASIVAALRRTGELDNTYIFFTSDNGYMQVEHDVPSGKMLPYESSTRVPLLLRGPGIPAGRVSRELVGNADLAPSMLEIAAARPGKVLDGRSLLPFARHADRRSRRPLLHETFGRRYVSTRDHDSGEAREVPRRGLPQARPRSPRTGARRAPPERGSSRYVGCWLAGYWSHASTLSWLSATQSAPASSGSCLSPAIAFATSS